jgi:regulator of protease activity HflC (stomatin/prohibitin superfamily)
MTRDVIFAAAPISMSRFWITSSFEHMPSGRTMSSTVSIVVAIAILFFALVLLARTMTVVPADSAYVVERLGRYHRTLTAGVQIITPFIDAIRFRYSLLPKDERLAGNAITLDNVAVAITSTFRWQIADAQQAAYATADVTDFVRGVVQSAQRQCISERPWDDLRETTRELQQCVLRAAAGPAAQAGLKIEHHDVERVERA